MQIALFLAGARDRSSPTPGVAVTRKGYGAEVYTHGYYLLTRYRTQAEGTLQPLFQRLLQWVRRNSART